MTAILGWGFVGKQVRPSIIALLASVSFVLVAVVGIVAALPDGSTVSDEATALDGDLAPFEPRPIWEHAGPNYGYDPSGPASYNALSILVPTHAPPARAPSEENTVPEWVTSSDEEPARPQMMAVEEYALGNCASVIGCYVPIAPYFDAELEADALEYQTLLASLSPGVRASYHAWLRDRADARAKEREREAAERERDEAEYAVFIEEHLRRLNTARPSRR
jgi:hypothetical protein